MAKYLVIHPVGKELTLESGTPLGRAIKAGLTADAYWTLMHTTLDNVAASGAEGALTGPAARGDWDTIRAHLDAMPTDHDCALYLALCSAAARLAGNELPDLG